MASQTGAPPVEVKDFVFDDELYIDSSHMAALQSLAALRPAKSVMNESIVEEDYSLGDQLGDDDGDELGQEGDDDDDDGIPTSAFPAQISMVQDMPFSLVCRLCF